MRTSIRMIWAFLKEYWYRFRNCLAASLFYAIKVQVVPQFWEVSYQADGWGPGRLLLIHHGHYNEKKEDAPVVSFVECCRKFEGLGIVMEKTFVEYTGLDGQSELVKFWPGRFTVNVRQCQYDKCDIEYTEEIVKKPKLSGLCAELIA